MTPPIHIDHSHTRHSASRCRSNENVITPAWMRMSTRRALSDASLTCALAWFSRSDTRARPKWPVAEHTNLATLPGRAVAINRGQTNRKA
ncbi:Uncharacterised protein [Mycobacteroides abscessus]|nr:Uncharacterised protein [Mycobacteroides abscessus]